MRSRLTVGGLIAVLLVALAWAADPGADENTPSDHAAIQSLGIAVVDIGRAFRDHRRFQERLNSLRVEMEEAKQTLTARQVEIEGTQRKLNGLRAGTPEHEQTQLLLSRLQTELKLYADRLQQQFAKREMTLYADVYEDVSSAVEQYARQHGIRLVLRSNETAMDPDNRNTVLGAVNREVVYQEGLDITDAIVQQLNASGDASN